MTKEPLISIIIPVYNVEDYVTRSVKSVINQTYKNLEILLIDDGATDSSGRICDNLAKEDHRIKVFHTDNHGLSAARNYGLDRANGDYIGFVDSDDWIEPDMYQFLYDLIEECNADISCCSHYVDTNNKSNCKHQTDETIICNKTQAINMLLQDKKIHNYAWDKLYKRKVFDTLRYPEGALYEDIVLTYKLFLRCERIVINAQPKYHYIVRESSIVREKSSQMYISYFQAVYAQTSDLLNLGFPLATRYMVRRSLHTINHLILTNANDEEIQKILRLINPYHKQVGLFQLGPGYTRRWWSLDFCPRLYKKIFKILHK